MTPNASGATVGSTASLYLGPNTWGTSQNQISAVPNPDLQSILQFSGLLQSQLEVKDDPATPPFIWAWGNMAAPPDGNNTSGTVTSTLNITPTTATGTAVLKIDLLWMIYQSNPQTSATNTGFSVRVSSSCDATPLTVFANRLEDGTVTIGGDDNLAPGTYFITPGGDGVSITRTLNNVAHGCTFTIQVRPYTETDQIFPGQQGSVDVDLAIDARVTVTN